MKYLVVIALVIALLLLLYRRLRPYLLSARNFIKAIKQFQQVTRVAHQPSQPEKLVQCVSCGTWVPAGRALASDDFTFCSELCRRDRVYRKPAKRRA